MQDGGIFTMTAVVKQTGSMGKKPPVMLLMDWKTLHAAKLCIYACGGIKKKNPGACSIFQPTSTRLGGEGTWGDNLIPTIHTASTEANNIASPLLLTDYCWDMPSYSGSAGSAANGGNTCGRLTDSLLGPEKKNKKQNCFVSVPLHSPAVMEVSVQLVLSLEQTFFCHPGPNNTCKPCPALQHESSDSAMQGWWQKI